MKVFDSRLRDIALATYVHKMSSIKLQRDDKIPQERKRLRPAELRRNLIKRFTSLHEKHGNIVSIKVGKERWILLLGVAEISSFLAVSKDIISVGSDRPSHLMGDGVLTSFGERHKLAREVILNTLAPQNLGEYQNRIAEGVQKQMQKWPNRNEFDLAKEIGKLKDTNSKNIFFELRGQDNAKEVDRALSLIMKCYQSPWRHFLTKKLRVDIPGIPNAKEVKRELVRLTTWLGVWAGDPQRESLARTMLKLGKQRTDQWGIEDVRDNLLQMYFAGLYTTPSAIIWTLYHLLQYPECLKSLVGEIQEVLGEREPNIDDLAQMKYFDQIIKETLRICPSGPLGFWKAKSSVVISGYSIPAETILVTFSYITHRNGGVFREPDKFIPERFAQGALIPRGSYFPFGMGGNSCVGAALAMVEIKTTIIWILRQPRIEMVSGQRPRMRVDRMGLELIPGLRVRAFPR